MKTIIDQKVQEFNRLIAEYCRLESVAAQNRMMKETADWVEALLKKTGFQTQQFEVEGAPNYVFGEIKGASDFTLLLYNHMDVQPEDPIELWNSPPFELTEKDGLMIARGISDNKAGLITRALAMQAIIEEKGELPITIKWIVEGEEEIGSPHFDAMTKQYGDLLKADMGLWEGSGLTEDGAPNICLGFRGLLYVEYEVEVMSRDAHSGGAEKFPNAAWRLINALSTLRDEKGNNLIEGFYDDVLEPTESEKQAIRDNLNPEMEAKVKQMFDLEAFNNGLSGFDAAVAVYRPTTNIAGFISGYTDEGVKTVTPAKATAKMDFRLVPNQDPADLVEKIKKHLHKHGFDDVKVKQLGGSPSVVTPLDSEIGQKLAAICAGFNELPPQIVPLGGGTLPLLAAMKNNIGLMGASVSGNPSYYGSGMHSPNEKIRSKNDRPGIELNIFMYNKLGEMN